ncbi:type I restriction-modification system endonuclease [Rhodocyclus purpureus]|uniref:type I restriction-modification system endonuclease n=1 Tax=Rhodocyclus purpureus TaxID=1067 RepID=UPI00191495E1|nr:type I restriction-modification system endonuclease [Rhodocyclus purpureus]
MPAAKTLPQTNFAHLEQHDPQLLRLGMLAERYFSEDPNTTLLKLRQLAEVLAQLVASRAGLANVPEENQYDLLRRLQGEGVLPREVAQLFGEIRRTGNEANHALSGDHRSALAALKICWQLGLWFHRTFRDAGFKSGPFVPPVAQKSADSELHEELATLARELADYRKTHAQTAERLQSMQAELAAARDEQAFWSQMASEVEQEKITLARRLAEQQAAAAAQPKDFRVRLAQAASSAAESLVLDESATRKIIDAQLREAGWEADSQKLRYGKGTRPQKGRNLAIAEWPTDTGPADYVLFAGLTPIATVEAKRRNTNVSGALQQAKRYSRGFIPSAETELPAENWGADGLYRIPFAFSTNARPYLRQLATHSGIWFCDLRRPDNLAHPLDGWRTPAGLVALLKHDEAAAHRQLAAAPFKFGFDLRPYQQQAIAATEKAIAAGQREILVAMATGTGKTKTCIALIYRLLKARRFNRILFLVDRSALGEQAANAFKDTRMENLNTFADIFGIKELEAQSPDSDTKVHIATVQGMVKRILFAPEGAAPPAVDDYDCIVVDECHRGYLLDRELSDTELTFRGFDDYVSKYRRVLDWFAAVKIGLTATPALHTSQIFGAPIFSYSYREAVIDGYLVDYEPPIQILTELSRSGIQWKAGEAIKVYDPRKGELDLFQAPDEIKLAVEDFNRKVITESFNRVVCDYLASELDPEDARKTLIFCATDAHADMVVDLLKQAFAARYGSVDDDAVLKITGAADKPLELIRRYKNERLPNVAVTVDLLTTGIDVPPICNLVFLRRVASRILFDQMLGRATRRCDDLDKETFRVFDAVRIFEAIDGLTAMQPVVADPKISFSQLAGELASLRDEEAQALVRDQFVAKLQRKKRHLSEKAARDFETLAGMNPDDFIRQLRAMSLQQVGEWFARHPGLGEILDRSGDGPVAPIFISEHEDQLVSAESGFGKAQKPADYLDAFAEFIRSHSNDIPALTVVLTRPRDLTRRQLKELMLELDQAGFSETGLDAAWRQMTNHDIAARIVGYIRKAAIGDALMPWSERVDRALQGILASRSWTAPQRDWLKKIAAQTKANLLVDRDALDDPNLLFKREGGGFPRLDRIFDGRLQDVLDTFNESLWQHAAA